MTVGSATAATSLRHAMTHAGRPGPAQWTNLDGRVTLRTLILIRWIAVIGQDRKSVV